MRNLKKFLALVLAMMMTLSLMVTVNASDFGDSEEINSKYAEAVEVLTELGVINGYETDDGGTIFQPEKSIKRSEVAALLYRITTGDVEDKNIHLYEGVTTFSDVPVDYWYTPYVNYCADNGLIVGVGGDRFAPNSNVTGYQILVMMLRAIGYNNADEFTGADWKLKASGYATKLGIIKNLVSGSLGLAAERQVVAEIMFQSIQAPMVNYSPLLGYTTDLLVDASEVNANASTVAGSAQVIYAADVPNTLLYQTFKIVGKRNVLGSDNYGRPQTEWVKDLATDTVANGGKYIPNYIDADNGQADETANGKTNDAQWATEDTRKDSAGVALTLANGKGIEPSALDILMTPVKVYKGTVVTECQFSTDVNNNKTIDNDNVTEYLNGGKVATRGADLDINHTQEGTIGAPGRTTEVYKIGDDFIIVYIDTLLGVVTEVVPRTFDTAGNHVMSPASVTVNVSGGSSNVSVTETSTEKDFTEYKVNDLVLLQTWGMKELDANKDDQAQIPSDQIQHTVPALKNDFVLTANGSDYGVEVIGKATTAKVTVKGTFGTKNHKTGIETNNGNYDANVVYLADKLGTDTDVPTYYGNVTTGAWGGQLNNVNKIYQTVPTEYGLKMVNAAINKEYTLVLDDNNFVVGMTQDEATTDIGVVMGMEPVRISTGKWAIEAELMMMDKTTKTVRLLKNWKADGTAHNDGDEDKFFDYYDSMGNAEGGIGTDNLKAEAGVLVKIEAFNKNGETYYKVIETQDGKWTDYDGPEAVSDDQLIPGDADTLFGTWDDLDTPTAYTVGSNYSKSPSQIDSSNAAVTQNVDDNTKFLIGELTWDYSLNEDNNGGYADMEYSAYTGFKTIPLIVGDTTGVNDADTADVLFQRIGNNVFVFPNTDVGNDADQNASLNYTIMARTPVADPDLYLVYATGTTYQDYSTYKALKNGEPVDLKVSNNNLTNINKTIEDAMVAGSEALIRVTGTNSKGYATSVAPIDRDITAAAYVCFDKTGVIAVDGTDYKGEDVTAFYTVADDVVVKIVNMTTGSYYNATLDSVNQYELYTGSHAFVLDFDEYGYVDTIYIID